MFDRRQCRALPRLCLAAVAAIILVVLVATPAPGQYIIAPDGSFVVVGQQQALPLVGNLNINNVIVTSDYSHVRIGGTFSGVIFKPGIGGTGIASFVKPFDSTSRAKASYLYGGKNPPYPRVVFPWQAWW
jgi:hypothetical protein